MVKWCFLWIHSVSYIISIQCFKVKGVQSPPGTATPVHPLDQTWSNRSSLSKTRQFSDRRFQIFRRLLSWILCSNYIQLYIYQYLSLFISIFMFRVNYIIIYLYFPFSLYMHSYTCWFFFLFRYTIHTHIHTISICSVHRQVTCWSLLSWRVQWPHWRLANEFLSQWSHQKLAPWMVYVMENPKPWMVFMENPN